MTADFCDRPEPLPGAALAGACAAPDVLADRRAIAADVWPGSRPAPAQPPDDLVERLAAALASMARSARFSKDPGAVWQSQQPMAFWRSQARQRLHRLDAVARGLLVQAEEATARRCAAQAVRVSGAGR